MERNSMYKGQLKLAVSVEPQNNTLQVHVIEAANLRSRWKDLCDPYIQLQICPDENDSSRQLTCTLNSTNNPYYDHVFKLPLSMGLGDKRMVVSAWHRDLQKNCGEFLGCMSFGMKHLAHKIKRNKVEGWYHLLSDTLGHRKHLKVDSALDTTEHSSTSSSCRGSAIDLSRLSGMSVGGIDLGKGHAFSVTLQHAGIGYGFTIRGTCPARIGRVRENGPAHQAGIRHGDYVINVNAGNVTRSRAASVAELIKLSKDSVTIDLFRRNSLLRGANSNNSYASSLASSQPSVDLNYALIESSAVSNDDREDQENRPPTRGSGSMKRTVLGASTKDIVAEQAKEVRDLHPEGSLHQHQPQMTHKRAESLQREHPREQTERNETPDLWDYELSPIGSTNGNQLRNFTSVPGLSEFEENSQLMAADASGIPEISWNEDNESLHEMSFIEDEDYSPAASDNEECNDYTAISSQRGSYATRLQQMHRDSMVSEVDKTYASVATIDAPVPVSALSALQQLEQDYSYTLKSAVHTYSRPLRHCLVTQRQHQCIFQNIEKMAAISSFMAQQLQKHHPANVYSSRVSLLCDSMATYLKGLPAALGMLEDLEGDEGFRNYLAFNAQHCGIQLSDALILPAQHLKSVISHLENIRQCSSESAGSKLSDVISALSLCRQEASIIPQQPDSSYNNNNTTTATNHNISRFSQQQDSLLQPPSQASVSFASTYALSQSWGDSDQSSMASRCSYKMNKSAIEPTVLELQKKLVIPQQMKKFKLACTQRHFIFSGDLMRIKNGRQDRLRVLLLSDLLLVTRETESGKLLLEEDPVLLDRLTTDWDRQNVCEFVLNVTTRHGSEHSLVFQATSSQEKCVWKSILDQRISLNQRADTSRNTMMLGVL